MGSVTQLCSVFWCSELLLQVSWFRGVTHPHAPPSFGNSPVLWAYQLSSQKHFLFFSPHDHRKMVANVTLQAQKPNRKYSSQLEIYLMINIGADLPIYTT